MSGADFLRLPPAPAGMRIGLYGGSFNPPHAAHLLVARTALRRLRLDRLWWMVTPGNPLKEHGGLAPLAKRVAASRALAADPRITVTAFEAANGLSYTAETLAFLLARRPLARFVWIMGADSLADFHRWGRWREIAASVPLAIVDRPGATLPALASPAARFLADHRLPEARASLLASTRAPAFVYLRGPRSDLSSTALREAGARAT